MAFASRPLDAVPPRHPPDLPFLRHSDGYAHWGMLSAAEWFATNELKSVRAILDEHPGYRLVLTGHSLGAGTACLLAHWIKNKPEAA
jgi:alpha-beta hydrolase superfamily lysophospholipase